MLVFVAVFSFLLQKKPTDLHYMFQMLYKTRFMTSFYHLRQKTLMYVYYIYVYFMCVYVCAVPICSKQ